MWNREERARLSACFCLGVWLQDCARARRFIPVLGTRSSNPVRAHRCHLDPPARLSLSPPQAPASHLPGHLHLHPLPIPAPRSRDSRAAPPPAPIPAARRSSEASLSASSSLLPGSHGSQATSLLFFKNYPHLLENCWSRIKQSSRTDGFVLCRLQRLRIVPFQRVWVRAFLGHVGPLERGQRSQWNFLCCPIT